MKKMAISLPAALSWFRMSYWSWKNAGPAAVANPPPMMQGVGQVNVERYKDT